MDNETEYTEQQISNALLAIREDQFVSDLLEQICMFHKNNSPISVTAHYNGRVQIQFNNVVSILMDQCKANLKSHIAQNYPELLHTIKNDQPKSDSLEWIPATQTPPVLGKYFVLTDHGAEEAISYANNEWEYPNGKTASVLFYCKIPAYPDSYKNVSNR